MAENSLTVVLNAPSSAAACAPANDAASSCSWVERGHHRVYSALIALYCLDFFGFLRGKWGRFLRKLYGLVCRFPGL
jgi:hypothetical protein